MPCAQRGSARPVSAPISAPTLSPTQVDVVSRPSVVIGAARAHFRTPPSAPHAPINRPVRVRPGHHCSPQVLHLEAKRHRSRHAKATSFYYTVLRSARARLESSQSRLHFIWPPLVSRDSLRDASVRGLPTGARDE